MLDLCFSSNPTLVKNTHVIPGISDHDILVVDSDLKAQSKTSRPRKIYQYKKGDMEGLSAHLAQASDSFLDRVPASHSLEDNWAYFKNTITSAMDKYIPHKMSKKRHNLPWFTPVVRRCIRRKQRLYKKAKKLGTTAARQAYKQHKHATQKCIRQAHDTHVAGILELALTSKNPKPFWQYVKSKKQDNTGISPLKRDGQLVSDSLEQAEIINTQFQSVFTDEDVHNIPPMTGTRHNQIDDIDIQTPGVEKLLLSLNPGKASGPDAIPNRLLKLGASELAPMLAAIFRQSLATGTLPGDWVKAHWNT
jgi:hypothetical protein